MRARTAFCIGMLCLCSAPRLFAQDPVKVDPSHYTVISENSEVRILKIHYGPHEKSVMHSHPDSVVVFLTDATINFTLPDGKTDSRSVKAGDSQFAPASIHLPENTGDKEMDGILVELKGKAAKPPSKAGKAAATPAGKKK
jgi:quercetin dioxygenase-like cupin family protein